MQEASKLRGTSCRCTGEICKSVGGWFTCGGYLDEDVGAAGRGSIAYGPYFDYPPTPGRSGSRVTHKQNYGEFCRISFPYPLGSELPLPTTTITLASFAVLFIKGEEVRRIDFSSVLSLRNLCVRIYVCSVHLRRKRHQSVARKPNHFRCRNALAPARFWWTLTAQTDANTTTLRRFIHVATQLMLLLCSRFINARRRIVQPMIDQSNRAGKIAKSTRNTFPAPGPTKKLYINI